MIIFLFFFDQIGFFKSASVLCGPSPIRVNESVDSIETELSTLFNSENESPEIIKANETFQLKKEMLTNHGYSVIDQYLLLLLSFFLLMFNLFIA